MFEILKKLDRNVFKHHGAYGDVRNNKLIAYRCYGNNVHRIIPTTVQTETSALSSSIIQSSGYVKVDGHAFDLRQDGIYRFYRLPYISEQRLVSSGDLTGLLKTLGYLWQYGIKDGDNIDRLMGLLKTQSVVVGCGVQAKLAHSIFSRFGIQSRLVAVMSHEPWNGQDDGHTLLEIYDQKAGWSVYDPSFKKYFKGISIDDLCKDHTLLAQSIELPGLAGNGGFENNSYNYAFWVEERMLSENAILQWYQEKMHVPLIRKGNTYFGPETLLNDKDADNFKKCYTMMAETSFYHEFYPNKKT